MKNKNADNSTKNNKDVEVQYKDCITVCKLKIKIDNIFY